MNWYRTILLLTVPALAFVPLRSSAIFSGSKKSKIPADKTGYFTVRTTAYTHTESDHLIYGRKNAIGTRLRYSTAYTSAAADWSRFPVGTKFKMKDRSTIFIIDDYGSALVGTDTVDIYHTSKKAMWNWGVRHVDIKILEWGSFEKSREILEPRTKYKHIRQMIAAIDSRGSKPSWFEKKDNSKPAEESAPEKEPQHYTPPSVVENKEPIQVAKADPPKPVEKETPVAPREPAPAPAPPVQTSGGTNAGRVSSPQLPAFAEAQSTPAPATTPAPMTDPAPISNGRKVRSFRPVNAVVIAPSSFSVAKSALPNPAPQLYDPVARYRPTHTVDGKTESRSLRRTPRIADVQTRETAGRAPQPTEMVRSSAGVRRFREIRPIRG